jgi:hypothetical protein
MLKMGVGRKALGGGGERKKERKKKGIFKEVKPETNFALSLKRAKAQENIS